jgi:hypothetical protein
VSIPEDQGPELHDADESGKIEDLGIGITTVENAREIEKLCALVYLIPEASFE